MRSSPWPGIVTRRSRGIESCAMRLRAGSTRTSRIESERPEPPSGRRSEPSTSVVEASESSEPPGVSAARVGSSMRLLASSSEPRNCE